MEKEFRVYCLDLKETVDDAIVIEDHSHEDAVRSAAERYYHQHEGWEWMPSEEVLFVVVTPDGVERRYEIETEYEPIFLVSPQD